MTTSRRARISLIGSAVIVAVVAGAVIVTTQTFGSDKQHATGAAIGDWGQVVDGQPSVSFADDGTFGGNDSCNGFSGRWHETDAGVETSDTVMSLMACIDGRDQWLTSARTFRV